MQAVMYHYVRPETNAPPAGYYHLPVEAFRAQLDYLEERHTLLPKSEFFACLRGDRQPPDDGVVLTFDDGLADHHRWVLPELERRDLWGLFFVATDPIVDGRRLSVHRVHTLVSCVPGAELLDALLGILRDHEHLSVPASSGPDMYAGRDTAESVREFKRLLNQEIPYDHLADVLTALERRFPAAGSVEANDLYLSPDQLRELDAAGMVVGAHSVSHLMLSRLGEADQRTEIRDSRRRLRELLDAKIDLFAHPYGGVNSYTARTRELVREAGFEWAFTTQSGTITTTDIANGPLTLPRRDCTEIEHGETAASLPDSM